MNKSRGFSLLELLVVLAIVAILATLAVPSFKSMIQSSTMSSNVNTFLADMRFARSESIRLGGGVVMCRSNAPEATNPVCNNLSGPGGNGWVSGWIIFHDLNNNGAKEASEPLLRVQAAIKSIDSITESKASPTAMFQFTATGRLLNLNSATSLQFGGNPTFANEVQRKVCINLGGRARIAGDGYASCGTNYL
jgi:type IV fimbrial biogenesis protein FimT